MLRNTKDAAAKFSGRAGARWLVAAVGLIVVSSVALLATDIPQSDRIVTVTDNDGVYTVDATFTVPQAASFATAALTDYGQIPRYMPEVRKSVVLERTDTGAIVEQEAVVHFLMFSKRVHLVLEVQELHGTIRFRDRCGRSFSRYEGAWTVAPKDGATQITYQLSVNPLFDVPEMLLRRLLTRDASQMIERLKGEILERARQQ